tara:strand:- start:550 stop:885 length:336 start_codon:yes stop_codon:yes gene_type:complete
MGSSQVIYFPRQVSGEKLEQACIWAAKKLGYEAKSEDEFHERYSLGSVHKHRNYNETNIRVGNLFPALQVRGIKKGKKQSSFYIWAGFPHGFASEARIQKYLSTISECFDF